MNSASAAALAGKWSPRGILERLHRTFRRPADVLLALRIGLFLWSAPRQFDRQSLPDFARRSCRRSRGASDSVERIQRLRGVWLRLGPLRARDTCYMRAWTLFRFLDPGGGDLRLHLGVEPSGPDGGRLRGHAWVSLDGSPLEAPDAVFLGRAREIFRTGRDVGRG